nr:hypothetical protein [Bifidobacterium longum]
MIIHAIAVIGVVKYNSTARSRSSRLNIRKSFRSVSKKMSAAPYLLALPEVQNTDFSGIRSYRIIDDIGYRSI